MVTGGPFDWDLGLNMSRKVGALRFQAEPFPFSCFLDSRGHLPMTQIPLWSDPDKEWWWLRFKEGTLPGGVPLRSGRQNKPALP